MAPIKQQEIEAAEALMAFKNGNITSNGGATVEEAYLLLSCIAMAVSNPIFSGFSQTSAQTDSGYSSNASKQVETCEIGTQTDAPGDTVEALKCTIRKLSAEVRTLRKDLANLRRKSQKRNPDIPKYQSRRNSVNMLYCTNCHKPSTSADVPAAGTSMSLNIVPPTSKAPSTVTSASTGSESADVKLPNVLASVKSTNGDEMIPIGDGRTLVPARVYRSIDWSSYSTATRKLLTAVFPRKVLAMSSLTGKESPAFKNKPAKKMLDPVIVENVVRTVVEKSHVRENIVRTCVTTKCADEAKMYRNRLQKNQSVKGNKENNHPGVDSD